MKKLYTDTRTLYINGKPVNYYRIGNLRYGEPAMQKISIEDFKDLYSIESTFLMRWQHEIKVSLGFKKIKINKEVFRARDVKDIYILKQSKERKESHLSFYDLSRELSVPEFVEFCKDKGLSVNCQ